MSDIERPVIPFRVVIEMEQNPAGQAALKIVTQLPDPMALALVNSAYHELLSKKIRQDIKDESRIIDPNANGGRRLT